MVFSSAWPRLSLAAVCWWPVAVWREGGRKKKGNGDGILKALHRHALSKLSPSLQPHDPQWQPVPLSPLQTRRPLLRLLRLERIDQRERNTRKKKFPLSPSLSPFISPHPPSPPPRAHHHHRTHSSPKRQTGAHTPSITSTPADTHTKRLLSSPPLLSLRHNNLKTLNAARERPRRNAAPLRRGRQPAALCAPRARCHPAAHCVIGMAAAHVPPGAAPCGGSGGTRAGRLRGSFPFRFQHQRRPAARMRRPAPRPADRPARTHPRLLLRGYRALRGCGQRRRQPSRRRDAHCFVM